MHSGLGYLLDLSAFDQLIGMPQAYESRVDVFSDVGSLGHLAAGFLSAYVGDGWAVGIAAAFGGYELAKVSSGEPITRVAGTLIELGIGALLAALFRSFARG